MRTTTSGQSLGALLLVLSILMALTDQSNCRPIRSSGYGVRLVEINNRTKTKFPFPIPARLAAMSRFVPGKSGSDYELDKPMHSISDRWIPDGPNPLHN
ncbi:unnamed protein product [Linum trigynum]|uniref:Uncharacterized protein n=1 Tax=Linum trigynum TaxID=586398 RepID=A0AAV2DDB4_9ROSI